MTVFDVCVRSVLEYDMDSREVTVVMENLRFPNNTEPITNHFITQWLKDVDCFLG